MTGWNSTISVPTGGTEDCGQSEENDVRIAHGHPAEFVGRRMMFRADFISYNRKTDDLHAEGHVFFYNFVNKERIWCDKVDYHAERDNEHGTFSGHLVGETLPRIVDQARNADHRGAFSF